ncbi:MAG: hypothetical protein K5989_07815 [Lachnospiraceae bacterium]|nr:hypothetical protein [Lachnospiraceae bacterium]
MYIEREKKKIPRKRLGRQNGESLVETLAAMLIIVLGMLALSGAIIAGAQVNASAGAMGNLPSGKSGEGAAATITVKVEYNASSTDYNRPCTVEDGGLVYYK